MAEDSEKKFHSIMDKLFHAPKSSSSGTQFSRGRKRPNPSSALALVEPKSRGDIVERSQQSSAPTGTSQAPMCRPWDRGDLMRRLATFKSMTWFAKPKVVSAVNCARRGWINVEMDIIACESCGARLLFSAPSSWTQQQVEKMALVFSLKLDNGHKLLCPWVDNACDEKLAQFPPSTPPILVDEFRERFSMLFQLLALPVISSSATEYMRSPQLDQFLEQSSVPETEYLGNECEANAANLYHQAQKLISLCGWEPRSLPYVVDSKYGSNGSVQNANVLTSSHLFANRQNSSISVHRDSINEFMESDENTETSSGPQSDPNSVVLDCKLCGASVGLWTFSMVPRPMELFRLVGYTDINSENDSRTHDSGNVNHLDDRGGVVSTSSNGATSSKERLTNLNLTIAGGPPPAKQNFKATISLPVIGQNLRAWFSYDSEFRDRVYVNQEDIRSDSLNKNLFPEKNDHLENTPDHEVCSSTGNDPSPCLSHDISEKDDALTKENGNPMLEETNFTGQGTSPKVGMHDSIEEILVESSQNVGRGFSQNDKLPENAENVGLDNSAEGDPGSSQVRDPSVIAPDVNDTFINGGSSKDDSTVKVASGNCNLQQISGTDIVHSKEISLATDRVQIPVNKELVVFSTGKDLKRVESDKAMEFDPIKQHRHFCPWITSTGNGGPGWQQTLSALLREKGFSPPSKNSPSSASVIKVDDPITSVRRLFMSPSPKRTKTAHISSRSIEH